MNYIKDINLLKETPPTTIYGKCVGFKDIKTPTGKVIEYFRLLTQTENGDNIVFTYPNVLTPKLEIGKYYALDTYLKKNNFTTKQGVNVENEKLSGVSFVKEIQRT